MLSLEETKRATEKKYSHSSGHGGQNVNKVATKVQLKFDIQKSSLTTDQKNKLLQEFPDGFIHVYNQETRSQHRNEEVAFEHLQEIIFENLIPIKERKNTKAPHQTKKGKLKKMLKDKWLKYKSRFLEK